MRCGQRFALVRDGNPSCSIVLASTASPSARLAAGGVGGLFEEDVRGNITGDYFSYRSVDFSVA